MSWQREKLKKFRVYAVTDITYDNADDVIRTCEKLFSTDVDILQFRSKELSDKDLISVGRQLHAFAARYQKLFIVNDRVDIALLLNADGVHVGQDDFAYYDVKKVAEEAGKDLIIGVSTHDVEQARIAETEGVDYIGVGPIFKTPTKKSYKPVGLDLIKQVAATVSIPFVCIGGINLENVKSVKEAGGKRVAVVRAVFDAPDPVKAVQEIENALGT